MSENSLDRKDLKILAYKDRLGEALEQNADLRVELTVVSNQLQQAIARLQELETLLEEADVSEDSE